DLVAGENLSPVLALLLLSHRGPHIRVNGGRAVEGTHVVGDGDRSMVAVEHLGGRLKAWGRNDGEMEAGQSRGFDERGRDIVAVAEVGDVLLGQGSSHLLERHQV